MVGLVHDLERVCGLGWGRPGASIWLLGVPPELAAEPDARVGLAGSSYLERIHGQVTGRPPVVDLELEKRVQAFLRQAIAAGLVASAHDLSDGGLAVAAAEACIASGCGARLQLPASAARLDRLLFAEGGARVLVSVAAWEQALAAAGPGLAVAELGSVQAEPALQLEQAGRSLISVPLAELARSFEQAIPRRLAEAGPPPQH
jgi:phosphoribosylformylglycinamidine synthase